VVKITSLRMLLALAAIFDLHVHQMDVKTAFLYGHILEDIYMAQPEGYINPEFKHKICKLQKSLYDLKQSACMWYKRIDEYLIQNESVRGILDPNIYIKRELILQNLSFWLSMWTIV
jgi:hypothetical protein